MPDGAVAGSFDLLSRKPGIVCLQFLEADHIRGVLLEPAQQDVQPPIDPVDIVGCDFHDALGSRSTDGL